MAGKALLTIDLPAIQSVITRQVAREAVERALRALYNGEAVLARALSLETGEGEVHVKGAFLTDSSYLGFKFASGFPGNIAIGLPADDGFSLALEARTGRPTALLLDGGWLTHMRTAAAGALAAALLARSDARSAAIIGAGEQAAFQLAALREVRQISEVRVWSRSPQRAARFAAEHTRAGSTVTTADTPEQAIRQADVVITVTASREPLVDAMWLSHGTHLTAVGADAVGKRELREGVLSAADVLVADRVELCREVGELQYLSTAQAADRTVLEFADLVAGRLAGRTSSDQITLIDQCGLGVYDAAMVDAVMNTLGSTK